MNERGPKFPPLFDDELALPDLTQWIAFYGGYDQITPSAWAEWDRLYEAHAETERTGGEQIRAQGTKLGNDLLKKKDAEVARRGELERLTTRRRAP